MMLIIISLWVAVALFLFIGHVKRQKEITSIIEQSNTFEGVTGSRAVIDSESFDVSYKKKVKDKFKQLKKLLSPNAGLKLIGFFAASSIAVYCVNDWFFMFEYWKVLLALEPILFVMFILKLSGIQAQRFKDNFPDALNILSGALSSGQSIVHAFEYVGTQLENEVGEEFKKMSERLLIGEDPDDVLARSAASFPYVEYFFFAATIRINLSRGGQLKDVINRINRIMFEARAIEKKKNALTSEARASAKIIAALPVIFIMILKVTSPENYNFVMFEEGGKPIFYYVLVSEAIGFFFIYMILRGVR
ncbi:TPA: type II secretion system F family protein [Vibrio parahaemolyticus]|uniref:Type II secretion system F family protein n=2 Tax=Vibrio parahaemolyticus TaxID=670 RepID=A0AA47L8S3_VIBPH|nr:type II secretion system F family protein [Vibrio parahaemolyticus]EHK6028675.1 type II secretion system F family protein [Vibrio parahaemolyticus]EIE9606803.1 type II secretion system F family protein [Vibrio parahaemolyticus]EIO4095289.1 type II secretion system F family protein [Vibrio parahaemolyticus]EIY9800761.1 type II secretion system F family protein [Vibrio parahaemolyticus]EJC6856411.1 type II secretion system F family protein [Vibrio parahaemolyticus]